MQVAPTPPPCSILARLATNSPAKPTVKPFSRVKAARRRCRGVTDGSETRLHSGQLRRPPAQVRTGSDLVRCNRGVACLLAVANLTVKTNIRTARRGTLRGARTSSTMQADHRAWFACKLRSGSRTYVSNAKLDKNAGNPSQRTLLNRIHSDWMRATSYFSYDSSSLRKRSSNRLLGGGSSSEAVFSTAESFLAAGRRCRRVAFFGVSASLRGGASGPVDESASGKGGRAGVAPFLSVELAAGAGRSLTGGEESPPKRPKNRRRPAR